MSDPGIQHELADRASREQLLVRPPRLAERIRAAHDRAQLTRGDELEQLARRTVEQAWSLEAVREPKAEHPARMAIERHHVDRFRDLATRHAECHQPPEGSERPIALGER